MSHKRAIPEVPDFEGENVCPEWERSGSWFGLWTGVFGVWFLCFWGGGEGWGAVDYLGEIKPLLARECVKCHGASQQKGGLRLDTAEGGLKGGRHGRAWVPGKPGGSLILEVLEGRHESLPGMPYKRTRLSVEAVGKVREWIQSGAESPRHEVASEDRHWSFIPPVRVPWPAGVGGNEEGWEKKPGAAIDAWVGVKLREKGLERAGRAPKRVLVRRLFLDLVGLPPSGEQMEAALRDEGEGWEERLVDRLLASPHHGEKWARWWLDGARYADSNGYSIDSPRSMWPYRDGVVKALNADLGFDTFTLWQLAGDLVETNKMPAGFDGMDARVASGFHRNTPVNHEGGVDPEQFRVESVVDRVNTTATVWMGLSLGCAQCHDHKFDPFTMRDYYGFLAYFNSTENDGHGNAALEAEHFVELSPMSVLVERDRLREQWRSMEKELEEWLVKELYPRQPAWEAGLTGERLARMSLTAQEVLRIPAAMRTVDQSNYVRAVFRTQDGEHQEKKRQIEAVKAKAPKVVSSLVMKELEKPRETRLLIKGDFTRPGEKVEPGVLGLLLPAPLYDGGWVGKSNRLQLAHWLVDRRHPLTARVQVNRVWMNYFGRGLVETENDWGTQGSVPTHPELLDWLAVGFMENGWSLKWLHRQIVLSGTYQQESRVTRVQWEKDPDNRWLGRQVRLRMDAETVRDAMLMSSGLLDLKMGGPPVFPPQPEGLGAFTQNDRGWEPSRGGDRYRRALYTHRQRTTLHPALAVFDAPDGAQTCTRRVKSNTPLQALTLLNDPAFVEMAEALARRVMREGALESAEQRIGRLYREVLGRRPDGEEVERLMRLVGDRAGESSVWVSVARVVMNLDEAVTRE